jgi:hypothetical protein
MEVLGIGTLLTFIIGIITLVFHRIVNKALDKRFEKMDMVEKRREEKDYLIVKGLMMMNKHQQIMMTALKRAKIEDNRLISINGELEEVEKDIADYNNQWEDYLIKNQEK